MAFAALALAAAPGCSGASGSGSEVSTDVVVDVDDTSDTAQPWTLTVLSPVSGSVFLPGEKIPFHVETNCGFGCKIRVWSTPEGVQFETPPSNDGKLVNYNVEGVQPGGYALTVELLDPDGRVATKVNLAVRVDWLPSTPGVRILPEEPTTVDDLRAEIATVSTDADGDPVEYRYIWVRNGSVSGNASTLSRGATTKGDLWRVVVTPFDGHGEGLPGIADVVIANAAPSVDSVGVLPQSGYADQTFSCIYSGWDDPDGDEPVQPRFRFFVNDLPVVAPEDEPAFPIGYVKGDRLCCAVVPSDGEDDGAPIDCCNEGGALVMNSLPVVTAVSLSATSATVTGTFTCQAAAAYDADGDPVSLRYRWHVDEQPLAGAESDVLPGSLLKKGQAVTCMVSGFDGDAEGPATGSNVVIVGDALPGVVSAKLEPVGATEESILTCTPGGLIDPDGDPTGVSYEWSVNGVIVPGVDINKLDGEYFDKGDVVTCMVTPNAAGQIGPAVTAKPAIIIQNTPPRIADVDLSPLDVGRNGQFTCTVEGLEDPDPADSLVSGTLSVLYSWHVIPPAGSESIIAGENGTVLQASSLLPGSQVWCTAIPTDGLALGDEKTSNIGTLVNHRPILASVAIGPVGATAQSKLVCTPQGFSDGDDDEPVYTYAWTKNGAELAGQAGSSIEGAFAKNDVVRCVVTPGDGYEQGQSVASPPLTIANALPGVGAVELTPAVGSTCQGYTCRAFDVHDADPGDTVDKLLLSYRWEKNGEVLSYKKDELKGVPLVPGDVLRCHVKASDGAVDVTDQAIYGAEATSNEAIVENAAPTLSTVELQPAVPYLGETLSCEPSGYEDPDCAALVSFTYRWFVDGEVAPDATLSTLGTAGYSIGTAVQCQATPSDGMSTGSSVLSAKVTLLAVPPDKPVVTIDAPQGADGPVTCRQLNPPGSFVGLTAKWIWSIGSGDEFEASSVLPATSVAHCDRVACRVSLSNGWDTVTSNTASHVLPVGGDCDDQNPCTSETCKANGGCAWQPAGEGQPCARDTSDCILGLCSIGTCAPVGPMVSTGVDDLADGIDNDCDGLTDENDYLGYRLDAGVWTSGAVNGTDGMHQIKGTLSYPPLTPAGRTSDGHFSVIPGHVDVPK